MQRGYFLPQLCMYSYIVRNKNQRLFWNHVIIETISAVQNRVKTVLYKVHCIMRRMRLSDCRTTAIGLSDIELSVAQLWKLDAQTLLKGESYIFSLLLSYAGSGTKAHTGNPKTNTVFLTSFEIQIKKLEFHRACHSALMRTSFRVGFSFNHTYFYCDRMRWIKYILWNWVITQVRKYINVQRVSAEARKWEEKSSRYKYCTQRSREPL
jgi:hypothetical protein